MLRNSTASWEPPKTPGGSMTRKVKSCGSSVSVQTFGAFAEMPLDVNALADVFAPAPAADLTQYFSTSALKARGMYKQHTRAAWGHAAHREWPRLLLDRRRYLVVHESRATRSAGGKFDGEEQQRQGGHHCHCWAVPLPWLRLRRAPGAPPPCHTA